MCGETSETGSGASWRAEPTTRRRECERERPHPPRDESERGETRTGDRHRERTPARDPRIPSYRSQSTEQCDTHRSVLYIQRCTVLLVHAAMTYVQRYCTGTAVVRWWLVVGEGVCQASAASAKRLPLEKLTFLVRVPRRGCLADLRPP